MRAYQPVDLGWIAAAPLTIRASARLAAAPGRVFDALADADGWTGWWPLMHVARWTTPAPHGVGSEREVAIRGLGRLRERFVAFEPGARFAFTMLEGTNPLATAIVEDYLLSPDGGGTDVAWTIGAAPTALGRIARPAVVATVRAMFARAMRRLDARLA